jgi:hypothetical protein
MTVHFYPVLRLGMSGIMSLFPIPLHDGDRYSFTFTPFQDCCLRFRRATTKGLISKSHLDFVAMKSVISEKEQGTK